MDTFCAIIATGKGLEFVTIEAESWEDADAEAENYARGMDYCSVLWVDTLEAVRHAYEGMRPIP